MAPELLVVTPAVANMIRQAQPSLIYQALETGAQHGMQSFDKSLISLAKRGAIDPDLAVRQARNQKSVAEALGRAQTIKA